MYCQLKSQRNLPVMVNRNKCDEKCGRLKIYQTQKQCSSSQNGKWMLSEVYQRMSGMFSNRVLNENMGINQDYLTLFPK